MKSERPILSVGLYARVSTRDKHQDPELQLAPMRDYARRQGWTTVEFVDSASAADMVGRRAWGRMMVDVRAHRLKLVMCWKLDRCFRSSLHAHSALEEFARAGVGFRCHTQEIDTTTPTGRLVFAVLAAVAEMERELIRERVKAGMEKARADGKPIGRPRRVALPQDHRQWATVLAALKAKHITRKEAAKKLGVRYATFQKAVNRIALSGLDERAPSPKGASSRIRTSAPMSSGGMS
jgi:DNA invertase Pin-like site-specific DNA recombinase